MRIGEYCEAALRQIGSPSSNCGVFLTAHNPHSEIKSERENADANGLLAQRLSSTPARGNQRDSYGIPGPIKAVMGVGRDPKGIWPGEVGYFFTWGLPVDYLLPYALEFGQNAFVYIPRNGIPQLIEVDHVGRLLIPRTTVKAESSAQSTE
jgi:hypothetical protein